MYETQLFPFEVLFHKAGHLILKWSASCAANNDEKDAVYDNVEFGARWIIICQTQICYMCRLSFDVQFERVGDSRKIKI